MERIQGLSVRDYAFRWAAGGCPIQQWASGARGIDEGVIAYVQGQLADAKLPEDRVGLGELVVYLEAHQGEPASPYIPDAGGPEATPFAAMYQTTRGDTVSCADPRLEAYKQAGYIRNVLNRRHTLIAHEDGAYTVAGDGLAPLTFEPEGITRGR